ncbi:dihydrolipoamide acetyltransferase family protein [Candidatus Mycobacterium methanotrophicum]|uniref:Dihydrolipoamide acetyltransferase component of pyruvate dehydrogenase complex n=1 Tax=Candidatus Mycobacterium methanotrophicum TaxID=2943498 RepID=A0ABY4QRX5_9MYCO|nr:dihydrolipoamide acetyltransferase family protein [Candidatus Mycobacterium methanotrophicum]UQX12666.1 2-oxo acid dehydrogenase subunit E2 [Candidatus Mycobacterium methanotrophicum]
MTVKPFIVPDLGEGLEEVTLTCWNVAVGDDVELNQTLCSVETAKAEVEIPSPYAGRIVEICGAEGDVLPVGALLVRIDTAQGASNGASSTRRPVLVGYGADDSLDASRRASSRPKAKPPVRKLAADLRVDLRDVPPGPDGLITREVVEAAAEGTSERDVLPVHGVHAEMAARMTLSRKEIPDAHASVQVDCSRLLELHDRLQVSPFALTLRLLIVALTHHKLLNSTWVDGADGPQVHSQHAIHLGFAVAAPRGLLVPVIADAQDKTTREIAEWVARLTEQARAGSLKPTEMQGSTFTVSNFGALGLDDGVPVINYPEAAILGMGSLKPRAVVVDDAVVVRPQMTLTCAFDHRIADGAQVAAFLGELRRLIESPETALLDL